MASKTIDIIISTILKKTGIDAARAAMKNLASSVGKNLTNIKSAFDMAGAAIGKFVSAMSKGMEFERMTVQFKSLTGSMELARSHMKDLQDLGRTPPFSLEQFAAASQAMMKMTGGMAGFKAEMEIVGDMAAATGNDIATVGRAFGLAYQVIRDGQDFGRAGQQLYSLGIMTKKQVAEFAELSKAGTDNAAVWEKLQEVFGRYKGAMAATEQTTKGLVEAIQGEATVAMTDFSAAISESAKPALEGLLGWMKRINEDGSIEDWADSAAESLSGFIETAKAAIVPLAAIFKVIKTPFESVGQGIGNLVGTLAGGGSVGAALKSALQGVKQGAVDVWDADGAEADQKESRRIAKAKKRAEQAAKAEEEAKRRIDEDMAKAQAETDRKKAEEKAKAEADAAKKAEAERIKAVEAERKAREKMEAELHKQRVEYAKTELEAARVAADSKQSVVDAAQTEFDRAFAMYRSPDDAARQIAEERDYAADYKRLQKDAMRYGGKWRIDELSSLISAGDTQGFQQTLEEWRKSSKFTPEVESMVRAAAADKTKTTAEDELRKISKNTEDLGKKLEELISMK